MGPSSFITALVCLVAFSSFGEPFAEGQIITDEDTEKWPEGTLAARLENKFVEYKTVRVPAPGAPGDDTDVIKHPELLEEMSKADAVKAVEEVLGRSLAGSVDPQRLRKEDLIITLKTLLAEQVDPAEAEQVDPKL